MSYCCKGKKKPFSLGSNFWAFLALCIILGVVGVSSFYGKDFTGKRGRGEPIEGQFEAEKRRATYLFLPSRLWLLCRAERRRWCWLCSSDTRAVCSLISSLVLRWCFLTSSFISLYCFLCSRTKPFCCFNSSSVWASNSNDEMEDQQKKINKQEFGSQNLSMQISLYFI